MNLDELKAIREKAKKDIQLRQKEARIKIVVGMGTSGIASGAREVLRSFVDEIASRNLVDVMVTQTGEKGLCFAGAYDRGPRRGKARGDLRQYGCGKGKKGSGGAYRKRQPRP